MIRHIQLTVGLQQRIAVGPPAVCPSRLAHCYQVPQRSVDRIRHNWLRYISQLVWFGFSYVYFHHQCVISLSDYRRLVLSIGDAPVELVPEHMHIKFPANYPPKRACQLFLPILAL